MNPPHELDTWIGRLIGDRQRYRLEKRLGIGGMGDVFLAMDTLLGQQVALKLLKTNLVGSGELRKRFEREVAVCAALKSDHIVQVTDYGVTPDGHPFYVMEYLHGQTLGQLLRREKQLSAEQTVSIISQVCEGLHLAHEGVTLWRDGATASEHVLVIHRDLKPDNIFLVPRAQGEWVKILDFGIAKICDDSGEHTNLTNAFIGTFHYAAPEQFGVKTDLDARADIYSLGIILYEMLSGTDPFGLGYNTRRISDMTWAVAHTSKPLVPLLNQPGCGQLSPELEAVVMRCLQKEPDQRFASVDELNRALQVAVAIGNGASGTTSPQEYPLKQKTSPQLQLSVRRREQSIDSIETEFAKTDNLNQSLPNLAPGNGDDKKKVRLLLLKATTIVSGALLSASLAYYAYIQSQPHSSKQPPSEIPPKTIPNSGPTQNNKLLARAQKLANKNNLKDAIAEASKIQPDSSSWQSAQQLIIQWSKNLLQQAEGRYKQSYNSQDLENAIALTKAIPQTTSVAKTAGETSNKWRTEWNNNENYLKASRNALNERKWQEAIDTANKVRLLGQEVKPDTFYWQNKMKPIIETAQKSIADSNSQESGTNDPVQLEPPQVYSPAPVKPPRKRPVASHPTQNIWHRPIPPYHPPQPSPSVWTMKRL